MSLTHPTLSTRVERPLKKAFEELASRRGTKAGTRLRELVVEDLAFGVMREILAMNGFLETYWRLNTASLFWQTGDWKGVFAYQSKTLLPPVAVGLHTWTVAEEGVLIEEVRKKLPTIGFLELAFRLTNPGPTAEFSDFLDGTRGEEPVSMSTK